MNPTNNLKKKGIFLVFLIISFYSSFSFTPPWSIGSYSNGLGNIRMHGKSSFSVYNLPSFMMDSTKWNIALMYGNPYGVSTLSETAISAKINQKSVSLGACYYQLGYSISSQRLISFSVGISLNDKTSLGCSINGFQQRVEGFNSRNALAPTVAFSRKIADNTHAHFLAFNPILNLSKHYLPNMYSAGLNWITSSEVCVYLEVKSQLDKQTAISLGLEYSVRKQLTIVAGVQTYPRTLNFGFSIRQQKFKTTGSFQQSRNLGFSPMFNLEFADK